MILKFFALAAALATASVSLYAAEACYLGNARLSQPAGAAEDYTLNLNGCPLVFTARRGGFVAIQSSDDAAGYFSHDSFGTNESLNLTVSCVMKPASVHCPTVALSEDALGSQIGERPTTWQIMRVKRYANFNRRYGGEAFASNLTGVPRQRQRVLSFCLGDERRSVIGQAVIGNERHDIAASVLALLGSVRLIDNVQPVK